MWWVPTGAWFHYRGKAIWQGPEQVEDKSRASIARCFAFLLSRPYLSAEDRERLEEQRFIRLLQAKK